MKVIEISRVAVVGMGTMGPKIAYRCIVSGFETFVFDSSRPALHNGMNRLESWLTEHVGEGRITADQAKSARGRLHFCTSLEECVSGVHLVIETVPEDLELKRRVFSEIDGLAPRETLICTNSSSLPCSKIADATERPDRIFNVNFSDPTHDRLVELMKGTQTANETILAAERFLRSLNMVPVITLKEIMGFSFNRIWRAIKREALFLVDQGFSSFEDIDRAWILEFGTPFGPFGLMDMIGLDVVRDIEMQYYLESGEERDRPPKVLDRLISQGHLGTKTGQGFYSYPDPDYKDPAWLHKEGRWREDLAGRLGLRPSESGPRKECL